MIVSGIFLKHFPSIYGTATVLTYASNIVLVTFLWKDYTTTEPHSKDRESPNGRLAEEGIPFLDSDEDFKDASWQKEATKEKQAFSTGSLFDQTIDAVQTIISRYFGRKECRLGFLIGALMVASVDVWFVRIQWTSKRFDWTFAAVSYINSYTTVITMFVLLALPFFASNMQRKLGDPRKVDIHLFRFSMLLMCVGNLAMSISPNRGIFLISVGIQALGAGTWDCYKSFLIGLWSKEHVTELYGVVSAMEYLVRTIDCRIWAWILVVALRQGGLGMGLPFWVSAALGLLTLPLMRPLERFMDGRRKMEQQSQEMTTRIAPRHT